MTLHTGDCLDVMREMPDASVDAVVTDPPYGLEFMGKGWDKFGAEVVDQSDVKAWRNGSGVMVEGAKGPFGGGGNRVRYGAGQSYQAWCEAWGREALRVTVPGGYLLAFGGTRTHHRLVCGLEDAGWLIRDELDWIYASGFPKGRANLKPAHEPIVLARKPGPLRHLEIDRCRIPSSSQDRDGSLESTTAANAGQRFTTTERELWSEPSATDLAATPADASATSTAISKAAIGCSDGMMGDASATSGSTGSDGRKPTGRSRRATSSTTETEMDSTTGSPTSNSSVEQFTTDSTSHNGSKNPDNDGQRFDSTDRRSSPDSVSGRWPSNLLLTDAVFDGGVDGVVGGGETASGIPGVRGIPHESVAMNRGLGIRGEQEIGYGDSGTYSRFFLVPKSSRSDREPAIPPEWYEDGKRSNIHPTCKPIELMRHLVRLVTPPGGTVLDPFLGSGTTAIACEMEGFAWIGIEQEPEYVAIAEARLNGVQRGLGLPA